LNNAVSGCNVPTALQKCKFEMSKRVAIVQSNYIPWKGYFDLIHSVDEFILFDDMQYTRRDWRNRNKIKTPKGTEWLTIPVDVSGKYYQKIRETQIANPNWAAEHWKAIAHNYGKARYFSELKEVFYQLYEKASQKLLLSEVNYHFITAICQLLNITTQISWSWNYQLADGKTERLVSLCSQAQATHYISGPAAKSYMDLEVFLAAGIEVSFFDYSNYPEYEQRFPPFEHAVSIVDLIFNQGDNAFKFMKSF
jgi:hypothetical protein